MQTLKRLESIFAHAQVKEFQSVVRTVPPQPRRGCVLASRVSDATSIITRESLMSIKVDAVTLPEGCIY